LGDHCVINRGVLLDGRGGQLFIGNNVDIAQEAAIWTLGHDPHDDYHGDSPGPVTIGDYAWIGHRAIIMPGVSIGRGAVVAAGAAMNAVGAAAVEVGAGFADAGACGLGAAGACGLGAAGACGLGTAGACGLGAAGELLPRGLPASPVGNLFLAACACACL